MIVKIINRQSLFLYSNPEPLTNDVAVSTWGKLYNLPVAHLFVFKTG